MLKYSVFQRGQVICVLSDLHLIEWVSPTLEKALFFTQNIQSPQSKYYFLIKYSHIRTLNNICLHNNNIENPMCSQRCYAKLNTVIIWFPWPSNSVLTLAVEWPFLVAIYCLKPCNTKEYPKEYSLVLTVKHCPCHTWSQSLLIDAFPI